MDSRTRRETLLGLGLALGAFSVWGLYPLLWALMASRGARPLEILAHRLLWAHAFGLLAVGALVLRRPNRPLWPTQRSTYALCALSGAVNVINWLVCIWAATSGHLIEASFGYFLAPLMAAALGVALFHERLVALQQLGIATAAVAVATAGWLAGRPPWVALIAAATAAGYAAIRREVRTQAAVGLVLETAPLVPLALWSLFDLQARGGGTFATGWGARGACLLAGLATAVAIVAYAGANARLRLSTLGVLQFIYPTAQLLLGALVFDEAVDIGAQVTLVGVVCALLMYGWGSWG